jgi:hypothetical protein
MKLTQKQTTSDKPIINFLLHRWESLITLAGLEYVGCCPKTGLPVTPDITVLIGAVQPIMHIEMIKARIVQMIPAAAVILPDCKNDMGMSAGCFTEIYAEHQMLSINKVRLILAGVK